MRKELVIQLYMKMPQDVIPFFTSKIAYIVLYFKSFAINYVLFLVNTF